MAERRPHLISDLSPCSNCQDLLHFTRAQHSAVSPAASLLLASLNVAGLLSHRSLLLKLLPGSRAICGGQRVGVEGERCGCRVLLGLMLGEAESGARNDHDVITIKRRRRRRIPESALDWVLRVCRTRWISFQIGGASLRCELYGVRFIVGAAAGATRSDSRDLPTPHPPNRHQPPSG